MGFRQFTVTTAEQSIAPFERRRSSIVLKNLGAARVFISHDRQNIATKGMALDVGDGMAFEVDKGDDTRFALYALTSAGTGDLRMAESFLPPDEIKKRLGETI